MVKSEQLQVVLKEGSVFITTLKGPRGYEFVILKLGMVDTAMCKSIVEICGCPILINK